MNTSTSPNLKTWAQSAPRLVAVAAGREAADLVIKGGTWVNVHTRETLENHDLAIADGRFAFCGPDASHCIGPDTEIIEANGRYMIPGLCDGHMHIESGMLTPAEFARAVIPHGTTTMFTDPHEIANVLGLEGVRMMHDEALMQPVNIYTQMPSCAPSAPGLETTGFEISADDVSEA
ncbi:MAG: amidohydrolase family protein, partial [Pseudomonadota bacterium]